MTTSKSVGVGAVAPAEGIDTSIYGMPVFVTLRVADLAASVRWYVEGLGLYLLAEMGRRADGQLALVHLRRWRYQDILLVPAEEPVTPANAVTLSFAATADELDALVVRAQAVGGGRISGPVTTRWGTTDVSAIDPDGHTLVFTAPPSVIPETPAEFTITTR